MKIAFDIDDTLIIPAVATGLDRDTPNYETIAILKWFQAQGHQIILWSGSGMDWARTWGEKLGLQPFTVLPKEMREDVSLCFDDCDVALAQVNVKVKRLNNNISRKDWNEEDRIPGMVYRGPGYKTRITSGGEGGGGSGGMNLTPSEMQSRIFDLEEKVQQLENRT